jgi:hypothetical protein
MVRQGHHRLGESFGFRSEEEGIIRVKKKRCSFSPLLLLVMTKRLSAPSAAR